MDDRLDLVGASAGGDGQAIDTATRLSNGIGGGASACRDRNAGAEPGARGHAMMPEVLGEEHDWGWPAPAAASAPGAVIVTVGTEV